MVEKEIICVICPQSCRISVKAEEDEIKEITGFTCKRGEAYAKNEFTNPVRTLTSTVLAENGPCPVISVRSDKPIPKDLMFGAMEEIKRTVAKEPFYIGKVIIENILGTGANIILTNR